MSLRLHLPLTGDTHNQGLSNVAILGSPASWGNGKLGKCATFGGSRCIYTETTHEFDYLGDFSFAFWLYPVHQGQISYGDYIFTVGRADYNSYGYGAHLTNSTTFEVWYGYNTIRMTVPAQTWCHIAFTRKGNTCTMYLNGQSVSKTEISSNLPTYTESIGVGIGCFHFSGGDTYYGVSSINDFRIYDNAISDREVKELAKGLVTHYPLSSNVGNNLISGMFECTSTKDTYASSGHITVHLTAEEILANKGKTLCFSYRTNSKGASQSVGADWQKTRFGIHGAINITTSSGTSTNYPFAELLACSKEEGLYYTTWTIPTNMTANDALGFVIQTRYTEGFAKPSSDNDETWWIKQVKLEWGDKPTVWCPNSNDTEYTSLGYTSNIEYDASGLSNHGTIKGSAAFSINNDSPRYDNCYKIGTSGTSYVNHPGCAFENIPQGTVSLWINRHSASSTWRVYLFFADSFNWTCNEADFIILGSTGDQNVTMDCCSNAYPVSIDLNRWYLFTITWNLDTHTAIYYVNGEKVYTVNNSRISTTYAKHHAEHYIGNMHDKIGDYSISDFRLYSTALSATDVKALYNAPISITNNGTLMTQGEFKEE